MPIKKQIIEALADTRRPCVRITPEDDKVSGPTDSKFGGDFYLSAGAAAPEMEFLAQINFSQVPRLEGFPEKGLLQFFLRTGSDEFEGFIENESVFRTDSGFFQVRWYPEVPADGPVHPDKVPEERWPMEKVIGGMRFEAAEETASIAFGNDCDFVADLGCEAGAKAVAALFMEEDEDEDTDYDLSDCSGVNDLTWDFGNWGFKLGGHPSLRFDDLRLEDAAYAAYSVLLFQFDLTPLAQDCEADTICFFIKPEDLEACRFDDILMVHHNCY